MKRSLDRGCLGASYGSEETYHGSLRILSEPIAFKNGWDALTFDERWARWQEKGARHDARVRRNMRRVAAVTLLMGFVWALVSLR